MAGGDAYDELGPLYDVWCAEVVEDIPFWTGLVTSLAHDLGRPRLDVLELGCGSGRISLTLARAGHSVTGIDLSNEQLALLTERTAKAGLDGRLETLRGDMRELATLVSGQSFDAVLVPFRGMLHVTAERDSVLAAARSVLRPGGVVAFDVFHPDAEQVAATHDRWIKRRTEPTTRGRWRFDERGRYATAHVDGHTPDELLLTVDVRCTWSPTRRSSKGAELPDPGPDEPTRRDAVLQLRLAPAASWLTSLEDAGLVVDGAYGWFDGRPLAADDDDSIWVARRAD